MSKRIKSNKKEFIEKKEEENEKENFEDKKIKKKIKFFSKNFMFLIIGIISVLIYWNTLYGTFIFDDEYTVVKNMDVSLSEDWKSVFFHDYWGKDISHPMSHKSYRPITTLTFRLNFWLSGKLDAWNFHFGNIIVHLLSTLSFFILICYILNSNNYFKNKQDDSYKYEIAFFASLFFATHPIHTEAVANLSGRAEPLCAFFFDLALICWIQFCKLHNLYSLNQDSSLFWKYLFFWIFSMIFAILSSLSKETGFTIFGTMLLYDILLVFNLPFVIQYLKNIHYDNSKKKQIKKNNLYSEENNEKISNYLKNFIWRNISLFLVFFILIYIRFTIMGSTSNLNQLFSVDNRISTLKDWHVRFMSYAFLHSYNVWLLLFPYWLSADYTYNCIPFVDQIFDIRNLFTLTIYGILFYILIKFSFLIFNDSYKNFFSSSYYQNHIKDRNSKAPNPLIQDNDLLELKNIQERRILFGIVGLGVIPFIPASNIFFPVGFVIAERILYLPSIGYCFLLSYFLFIFIEKYENEKNLFEDFKKNLIYFFIFILLIFYSWKTYTRNEDWNRDQALWETAFEVCPNSIKVRNNLANAYIQEKKYKEAMEITKKTMEIDPGEFTSYILYGIACRDLNLMDEAVKSHLEAVKLNPSSKKVLFEYLITLEKAGRKEEANKIRFLIQNQERDPNTWLYETPANQNVEVDDGNNTVYKVLDGQPETYYIMEGSNFFSSKSFQEAALIFSKGVQLYPTSTRLLNNLAAIYVTLEKYEDAIVYYKKALKGTDREPGRIYQGIATCYIKLGEDDEAVFYLKKSIEEEPNFPRSYLNLAEIYLRRGLIADGIDYFLKAYQLDPADASRFQGILSFLIGSGFLQMNSNNKPQPSNNYFNWKAYYNLRSQIDQSEKSKAKEGISLLSQVKNPEKLGLDEIYVINRISRKDRWNYIEKKLSNLGLKVTKFTAIEGNSLDIEQLIKSGFLSSNTKWEFCKGELGAALSHINIYEDMLEKNYKNVLIIEDDVDFDENFVGRFMNYFHQLNKITQDWEFVYLGGHDDLLLLNNLDLNKFDLVSENIVRIKNIVRSGYWGYLISNKGAKKWLKVLETISKPIDVTIETKLHKKSNNIFAFKPPLIHHPGIISETQCFPEQKIKIKK